MGGVSAETLQSWNEILERLGHFPRPAIQVKEEGEIENTAWVFRGANNSAYRLEPSIERIAGHNQFGWASMELAAVREFKARSHMHPIHQTPDDDLTCLALMQHYGIPTRLLDFTSSPFVALYFAVKEVSENTASARIWAVDAITLNNRFMQVYNLFKEEQRRQKHEPAKRVSFNPNSFASKRDLLHGELYLVHDIASDALTATGAMRSSFANSGSVCMTFPRSFNPRLASQQGAFLLNCAEGAYF